MQAADAVVVGAGVIGSSVALELARAGLSVVVVDKAAGPGQGSTCASSAVVRFNYSTWDGVAAAWESKHCWEKWPDHVKAPDAAIAAAYRRTGLVMLDVSVAPRERSTRLFRRAGIPYEEWDSDTLARRVPGIDVGRWWPPARLDDDRFWQDAPGSLGALWTPDAGYVDDPQRAAVDLAEAAQRRGADFRFRRRVVAVPRLSGRVRGVVLDDGTAVDAGVVVNVAGPWSATLNALAGVGTDWSVTTTPMRQEVHAVSAPPTLRDEDAMPVVADIDLGTYLRGAPGGGMLVGGTEPECDPLQWVAPAAVDDVLLAPTRELFEAQVTRAARRFPELAVPHALRGVAGVYDVTEDWAPIYDRTELEGYYVAIGSSGNQFKNAPVVGRFLAALVVAVEAGHDHDAEPVSVVGEHTGLAVSLGAFSRLRPRNADSTGTVMG